jgi:hypothetical protein
MDFVDRVDFVALVDEVDWSGIRIKELLHIGYWICAIERHTQ